MSRSARPRRAELVGDVGELRRPGRRRMSRNATAPPSTTARTRRPVQSGSMSGSGDVAAALAEPLRTPRRGGGSDVAGDRAIRWSRSSADRTTAPRRPSRRSRAAARRVPIIRGVTAAARPSDAPARPRLAASAGADAERPRGRPARLGALRLREHDLQLRDRVVRDGPVARRGRPVRRGATARSCCQRRDRRQRRAQRHRLADPRRDLSDRAGGRRLPFLLFFTAALHRPDARSSARRPALVGLRPVHRRQLRLPGGADLLRRDAADRQLPGDARARCRGSASAIGYCGTIFVGLLIFLLDLPVDERRSSSRPRCSALFAVPIFLVVREPPPPTGHAATAVRDVDRRRSASCGRRSPHAREVPGPRPVPGRAVLLLRRGQHDHRRDERSSRPRRWA